MAFWQRPERNEDLGEKCPSVCVCLGGGGEGPNKLVVFEEPQGAEGGIRKTEDHEGLALSWIFVLDFNLIMIRSLKWF